MQRQLIVYCFLFNIFTAFILASEPEINIVYPKPCQKMLISGSTFILGNVSPTNAKLYINDFSVPIYKTGGFLAYLPVKSGNFDFICKLKLSDGRSIIKRLPLYIKKYRKPKTTTKSIIEKSDYLPDKSIGILIGEAIVFQCKTLPDKKVQVTIENTNDTFPLYESVVNGVKGIYKTTKVFYKSMKESPFKFEVPSDLSIKPFKPNVLISVFEPYQYPILQVVQDLAKAREEPNGLTNNYLRKDTILQSSGYYDDWYRIMLSNKRNAFVLKNQMIVKPKNTPISKTVISNLICYEDSKDVNIKLIGATPINGIWVEYPNESRIGFLFYKTHSDIKKICYQPGIKSVKDIKWAQVEDDVLLMDFYLKFAPVNGYYIEFKNGFAQITIKKDLKYLKKNQIRICLDAGHGGSDTGATGPTGKNERDLTLKQIVIIGDLLKKNGYDVIYTRENNNCPSLYERAPFAFEHKSDIFISVHYNAVNDGVNPYKVRSTETYYYNRLGKKLGEFIHPKIIRINSNKDAGLKYGNFAVCRNNAVPSILLELDYIIVPRAEELIQSKKYRNDVANAILNGIDEYIAN